MTFPDDLPGILEYRCGVVIRHALPRTPVETLGSSGKTTAPWVCPTIPIGADAWRLVTETEWHPLDTLPKAWMPFLNRERPSPMDPRQPLDGTKKQHKDAIRDEVPE